MTEKTRHPVLDKIYIYLHLRTHQAAACLLLSVCRFLLSVHQCCAPQGKKQFFKMLYLTAHLIQYLRARESFNIKLQSKQPMCVSVTHSLTLNFLFLLSATFPPLSFLPLC